METGTVIYSLLCLFLFAASYMCAFKVENLIRWNQLGISQSEVDKLLSDKSIIYSHYFGSIVLFAFGIAIVILKLL